MDSQQIVLVTGTSSGFGRLIAETLARKGHTVFASMRDVAGHNADAASELRTFAGQEGLTVRTLDLDTTDEASVNAAVANVIAEAGRIDVVVNNAGVAAAGLLETFPVAQVRDHFDTNVFGPLHVFRAALPHMRGQGSGLIVTITSAVGRMVLPFSGPYTASKFALEALCETYRYELARFGVDSVIVEPGAFATNLARSGQAADDDARAQSYGDLAEMPARLFGANSQSEQQKGNPQEVADTVARLIETPPGQRPLRTLVGQDAQGIQQINDATEQMQRQMLEGMGLGDLLTMRTPARS